MFSFVCIGPMSVWEWYLCLQDIHLHFPKTSIPVFIISFPVSFVIFVILLVIETVSKLMHELYPVQPLPINKKETWFTVIVQRYSHVQREKEYITKLFGELN
jgi:hypothetical protein